MHPRRSFRFLEELSEGAFGKVYLAEMVTGDSFKSVVAIKLLHGKWTRHEEIVQRSRDEARVLGLLHHRNIIRVEDLTSINGQVAVVMEYLNGVDGKTLINFVGDKGGFIPRSITFEVLSQVASALDAAYYVEPLQGGEPLRLIHRDIKPSNVMLTMAGEVKVLDFGTAQAHFEDREAKTQALAFGSAAYMAPERLLGDPDAPSGDIFSLGVTLYEFLAMKGFGKIQIRPARFEEHLQERLDEMELSDVAPEFAQRVREMLASVLAYEASARPTAPQVVELLEELGEEVADGSLRRFCRVVVADCRSQLKHEGDPNDPLTGTMQIEDTSMFIERPATDEVPASLSDPGPGEPDTWGDEPSVRTPRTEARFTDEPNTSEFAPTEELSSPVDPVAVAALSAERDAPIDARVPPEPPGVVVEDDLPDPEPPPKRSRAGLMLGLLFVALLLGGVGVGAAMLLPSLTSGPTPVDPVTPTAQPEEELRSGGVLELGPVDAGHGAVALRVVPARPDLAITVRATMGDFREKWDGTGTLELVGLEAGTYRTKIVSAAERAIRATFEVEPGRTCSLTFDLTGGEEWQVSDCSE